MAAPRLLPVALAAISLFATTAALAQEASSLERVTVVGSRKTLSSASSTDTLVPVDIYSMGKLVEGGGQFDLAQSLQYLSPSFNSTRQTGADGADLIDSAALRGLGSDQTLVLVNGKRRHTVALVNLFGARNRGSTGTDMNSLPLLAIDNVQVLRDGAAAQYGSDAIAGVINIQLKKKAGCEAVAGYGQYSAGDGKNYLASAYCGVKLGGGTLAVTGEWQDRGRSNRADPGSLRTIGDTKVENKTVYLNGEFPVAGDNRLYVTAGAQDRDASSAAWARGGVGTDDIPSRNSEAMYPNGYVPFIDGKIEDRYLIVGWKSSIAGWDTDLSQTYGSNKLRYNINHTMNASIANKDLLAGGTGISPTSFDAGGFGFSQATTNFDVSRFFPDLLGGSNIAFGAEYRREKYDIVAGEPGSYIDADGVGFGGNAGSQGFPGFQPSDATQRSRNSQALYVDWEANLTPALTLDAALRGEHYSDFGSTTTAKLSGSYKFTNAFLLRGAASTGFRAPSLQQLYFSSTFTDFISGQPLDVVLAPNGSAIANAAGVEAGEVQELLGRLHRQAQRRHRLHRRPVPDQHPGPHRAVGPVRRRQLPGSRRHPAGPGRRPGAVLRQLHQHAHARPRPDGFQPHQAGRGSARHLPGAEHQPHDGHGRQCAALSAGLRECAAVRARAPVHRAGRPACQGHAGLRVQPGCVDGRGQDRLFRQADAGRFQ
jgi:iron complex outermembrane receptor protein